MTSSLSLDYFNCSPFYRVVIDSNKLVRWMTIYLLFFPFELKWLKRGGHREFLSLALWGLWGLLKQQLHGQLRWLLSINCHTNNPVVSHSIASFDQNMQAASSTHSPLPPCEFIAKNKIANLKQELCWRRHCE